MYAAEARDLVRKFADHEYQKYFDDIKGKAEKGETKLTYSHELDKQVVDELRRRSFSVGYNEFTYETVICW